MTGTMKWSWRTGIVCLINVFDVWLLTVTTWRLLNGAPHLYRQIIPGPAFYHFTGCGILFGPVAV